MLVWVDLCSQIHMLKSPAPQNVTVSVSSSCCNKSHRLCGTNNRRYIHSSQFWKLDIWDQGAGRSGSWEDPLPGLLMLCPHSAERERCVSSSSYKDTNSIVGAPPS